MGVMQFICVMGVMHFISRSRLIYHYKYVPNEQNYKMPMINTRAPIWNMSPFMKIRLLLSCRVTSSACSARHASRADNHVFSVLCPNTMMQVDRAWPKYGVHPEGQQLRTPEIKNEKLYRFILQLKETQSEGWELTQNLMLVRVGFS